MIAVVKSGAPKVESTTHLDLEVQGRQGSHTGKTQSVCLAALHFHHVRCASLIGLVAADGGRRVSRDGGAIVPSTTLQQQRLHASITTGHTISMSASW